jgi:hypothetical protein
MSRGYKVGEVKIILCEIDEEAASHVALFENEGATVQHSRVDRHPDFPFPFYPCGSARNGSDYRRKRSESRPERNGRRNPRTVRELSATQLPTSPRFFGVTQLGQVIIPGHGRPAAYGAMGWPAETLDPGDNLGQSVSRVDRSAFSAIPAPAFGLCRWVGGGDDPAEPMGRSCPPLWSARSSDPDHDRERPHGQTKHGATGDPARETAGAGYPQPWRPSARGRAAISPWIRSRSSTPAR